MNREIKFRIWVEERRRMFYATTEDMIPSFHRDFDVIYGRPPRNYESFGAGGYIKFMESESLWKNAMQFTGLKDMNGVDIYEGDFIEQNEYFLRIAQRNPELGRTKIFLVSWLESGGWNIQEKSIYPADSLRRVVGNIYENPELLND